MNRTMTSMMVHEDRIANLIERMEASGNDQSPASLMQQVEGLVASFTVNGSGVSAAAEASLATDAPALASEQQRDASAGASVAGAPSNEMGARPPAATTPSSQTSEAAAAVPATSPSLGLVSPSQMSDIRGSTAAPLSPFPTPTAHPSTSVGPKGLGMGLKPMAKKMKPTVTTRDSDCPGGSSSEGASAGGVAGAGGDSSVSAGAAAANRGASGATPEPPVAPPPDLMAMMSQMMGGSASGSRARAGGPTGGGVDGQSNPMAGLMQMMAAGGGGSGNGRGGAETNPMAGIMQMMAGAGGAPGGAAAGGGQGLGGLMQMASSIASDPAMQPLLQNARSSLMGGQGGAAAGGGGGLGGLLGSLMGGLAQSGSGNPQSSAARGGIARLSIRPSY